MGAAPAVERVAEQTLQVAFEIEEIDTARSCAPLFRLHLTISEAAQLHGLFDLRRIHPPQLENAHPFLLAVEIMAQRLDQATPQRGAHRRQLAGDGIGQGQRAGVGIQRRFPTPDRRSCR